MGNIQVIENEKNLSNQFFLVICIFTSSRQPKEFRKLVNNNLKKKHLIIW
jgi:hypothetical protein